MSDTTVTVQEMIKHEGSRWVVYSADGSKKLGSHPTEEKAKAQLGAIESSKARAGRASEGAAIDAAGGVVLVEGGRFDLVEGEMARMTDGQLKKTRAELVAKRGEKRSAHGDLAPENKYSSPEGSALLDDLYYYNGLISRLECEMADRLLALD